MIPAIPVITNSNSAFFAEDVRLRHNTTLHNGLAVTTGYLKPGVTADLIALSTAGWAVAGGEDGFECLDPAVALQEVAITIGDDLFLFNFKDVPGSAFVFGQSGDLRAVGLVTELPINIALGYSPAARETLTTLTELADNSIVINTRLGVTVSCNIETGEIHGNFNVEWTTVELINGATGEKLNNNEHASLLEKLRQAKVVGYSVSANVSTSNAE